ncbi:MAG TPA: phenylacetate-CoA oxygenase subunit PaaJ [Gammaproteobacteria bacterium]|nr:phenylacetate-CoA oxygenase subunit PaaJ [Xanthomonadales bacterium]HOP23129.1 phenylacetate-CoA oxygenase subunit PaaJ [Gammaproteobacteria bacterium]HPI95315.1 phenylacetate-CoA oxygenase subunit PaaJ [Gammaproteobacteria bacterium]HPQ86549.1 phenylacetate-CoA oxygenase subunit PaaJ [Gammaproteobacteria bacterium]
MSSRIEQLLSQVTDPEIPVLSLYDLGVIRKVEETDTAIIVTITPTYSGCPAMDLMERNIIDVLENNFDKEIKVITQLSPAWTTDWLTEAGKKALFEYGIMPPSPKGEVICPQCRSKNVVLISQFGSTACKSLYKCNDCLEPFDYFKCH